jgi:hypothetical protein
LIRSLGRIAEVGRNPTYYPSFLNMSLHCVVSCSHKHSHGRRSLVPSSTVACVALAPSRYAKGRGRGRARAGNRRALITLKGTSYGPSPSSISTSTLSTTLFSPSSMFCSSRKPLSLHEEDAGVLRLNLRLLMNEGGDGSGGDGPPRVIVCL